MAFAASAAAFAAAAAPASTGAPVLHGWPLRHFWRFFPDVILPRFLCLSGSVPRLGFGSVILPLEPLPMPGGLRFVERWGDWRPDFERVLSAPLSLPRLVCLSGSVPRLGFGSVCLPRWGCSVGSGPVPVWRSTTEPGSGAVESAATRAEAASLVTAV